ncbi:MAG: GNAT family N-acetyltransferase [Candidatus Taylorbacteria bacterium]|nr:GNAT family N-acetyltransferase [Candidatus Taylorbacteria bacterium]
MEFINFSPQFGYAISKSLDGIASGGTTGLWGMRAHKLYGSCREEVYPTDNTLLEEEYSKYSRIPIAAFLDAEKYKIDYYQRLYSLEDCMYAITKAYGIGFDFDIFESIRTVPQGRISLPKIGEKCLGSHSVYVSGYSAADGNERFFHFINSWGAEWGDNGRGYIPFNYFEQGLVSAAWAVGHDNPIETKKYSLKTKKKVVIDIHHASYPSLRYSKYPLYVIDIYLRNLRVGCVHMSPIDEKHMELEEFYILPQYQNQEIGTTVIKHVGRGLRSSGFSKLTGWIGAQDIINDREEQVKAFFKKNGFTLTEDNSRYRDSVYRVEIDYNKYHG